MYIKVNNTSFLLHILRMIFLQVFFFKAQLQSGQVENATDELLDHQWLTRSQVLDTVLPPYKNAVKRFILEL